jgi:hypothetical protein
MPAIPSELAPIILAFQPLMLNRTWPHAVVLLAGAILAPGRRTISSLLRITGRRQEKTLPLRITTASSIVPLGIYAAAAKFC